MSDNIECNSGKITINKRLITVSEITMEQYELLRSKHGTDGLAPTIEMLCPMLLDCDTEFLKTLAPSQLRKLYEKIKEVNADFFELIPLEEMLAGLKSNFAQIMMSSLSGLSAQSLQPDTVELP